MNVLDLINEVNKGTIVLPDFQRSFIWSPEEVRELLVSILGNYFIGSMLFLENLKKDAPFALRLVEGVEQVNEKAEIQNMVKIVLDGQQRTTSLFYALNFIEFPLKGSKNPYLFYLDLEKAIKKDWDNAVIAVSSKDKKRKAEVVANDNIILFSRIRDISGLAQQFNGHPKFNEIISIANKFMNYQINIYSLPTDTELETIIETFERINRTGEPLSTFELLTARLFKDKIRLRELLNETSKKYDFTKSVPNEFILKTISLMRGKEGKRKDLLDLDSTNFEADWYKSIKIIDAGYSLA